MSVTVFDNGTTHVLNATTPDFSPQPFILGVENTISLNAVAGGSADLTSFQNTSAFTVPEPISGALSLWGLAFVTFLLRCSLAKFR
jgi:hypothetical protein